MRNKDKLELKNNLKEVRNEKNLSQSQLAEMVGVSRNTISSIETGQFNPTAKLALYCVLRWIRSLKNYSIFKKIVPKEENSESTIFFLMF